MPRATTSSFHVRWIGAVVPFALLDAIGGTEVQAWTMVAAAALAAIAVGARVRHRSPLRPVWSWLAAALGLSTVAEAWRPASSSASSTSSAASTRRVVSSVGRCPPAS